MGKEKAAATARPKTTSRTGYQPCATSGGLASPGQRLLARWRCTNHVRGRYLKLVVHPRAEVLVQERLELLVLLLQRHRGVDRSGPALEQVVVFLEESVEGLPDVGVHFRDDVAHLLPKLLLFLPAPELPLRLGLGPHRLPLALLLLLARSHDLAPRGS